MQNILLSCYLKPFENKVIVTYCLREIKCEFHIDGIMYDYNKKYDKYINESCILRLQFKVQITH